MADRATVKVSGLKEFNRALRTMDADLPKGLRIALNGCADFLIEKTRSQIPQKSGKAARSLKARSTRTAVRIAVGGNKAPYYPWLDFGGHVGRHGSVARPFYREGRYLYPTLRRNRDEFTKIMQDSIVHVAEAAGLDVS